MNSKSLFITGTDTDVGKTFITALLGGLLVEANRKVAMRKPIASGALREDVTTKLYSVDAREHLRLTKQPLSEERKVNPLCLAGEFSPKIAAQLVGIEIDVTPLLQEIKKTIPQNDVTLIEGAGGITTPITGLYTFAHFAQDLGSPVLIVSDGRLGSINRAVLTYEYAKQLDLEVVGFIVNDQDDTPADLLQTNITEIELYTQKPVLATLPAYKGVRNREEELHWAEKYIDLSKIF